MNFISIGLRRFFLILVMVVALGTESAQATWSVIIGDTTTGELAAGSVTCLNGDLLAVTPMVLTGIGIGIVQGNGDPRGTIRPAMREAFLNGASAQEVLDAMMEFGGGNRRQFGICSTESCVSWTGGGTGAWSGGTAGQINGSNIVYAIQGNVLAGGCVVTGMLQAIISNAGEDIPDILMAAMETARLMGGDGRCSCGASRTDCGCPVEPEPDRTGIIGYMLVTRAGDSDDPICNADGCADGDYFMKINVTADASGPDPVLIMQQMFSNWRSGLIGQPDAVHSYVTIAPDGNNYLMTVYVQDWAGTAVGGADLVVEHAANSDQVNDIGVPNSVDTGVFEVQLTPGAGESGNDVFQITVQKDSSSVIIMPNAQVCIGGEDGDEDGFIALPCGSDCDDNDASVNPGADEVCDDGIDNNCNTLTDGADPDCSIPPTCSGKNESCSQNDDCCSGKCNLKKGKCSGGATAATNLSAWMANELGENAACPE